MGVCVCGCVWVGGCVCVWVGGCVRGCVGVGGCLCVRSSLLVHHVSKFEVHIMYYSSLAPGFPCSIPGSPELSPASAAAPL